MTTLGAAIPGPDALLLVRVTVLLGLGVAAALLLRSRCAADRHALWLAVLTALTATPFLTAILPAAPVLPVVMAGGAPATGPSSPKPHTSRLAIRPGDRRGPPATEEAPSAAADTDPLTEADTSPGGGLPVALGLLWILGGAAVGGRALAEIVSASILARRAEAVDEARVVAALESACRALGYTGSVRVRASDEVSVPAAWGPLRPVILLPPSWRTWTPERLRSVLLHEVSHAARRDVLTRILGSVACALYWCHPGVWYAWRRLRAEGERACDDRVILAGVAPERYAEHLLSTAREARHRLPVAALPMAGPRELESRLLHVLTGRRGRPATFRRMVALVTVGLVLTAAVASAAPATPTAPGFEGHPETTGDWTGDAPRRDPPDELANDRRSAPGAATGRGLATAPVPEGAVLRGPRVFERALPRGERALAIVRGSVAFYEGGHRAVPLDASSALAVEVRDTAGSLQALYLVQGRRGARARVGWGWPLGAPDYGASPERRREWEGEVLPHLWHDGRAVPLLGSAPDLPPYLHAPEEVEEEPARWSEIFPDLRPRDRLFIERATVLLAGVLPDADRDALREAAMEVWAHLNVWILWPGRAGDGHPTLGVSGHSHMTVLHGDTDAPMADVTTLAGPMEVAVPAITRRRLERGGLLGQARLARTREAALARAGAELASWWTRVITTSGGDAG